MSYLKSSPLSFSMPRLSILRFLPLYKSVLAGVLALLVLMIGATTLSHAAIEVYDFNSPRQEAQYRGLIDEFRCPKCQNQNLASSDAPIAQDLKQKTYDMVKDGRSDAEIRQYMQERYGDFISYNPPVRPSTWVLWFFPPLLLIIALGGWFWRNQRSRKHPATPKSRPSTRSEKDSSLNAGEQAALDRLLASRTGTGATTSKDEVSETKSVKPKSKNSSTKPKSAKNRSSKPKAKGQTRDKGDSL